MKGQLGIETIIALTIFLLFALIFSAFFMAKSEDINFVKEYLEARKICLDVKGVVDEVASTGNGSLIIFKVPELLEGKNYSISLDSESRVIRVKWDDKITFCQLLTNVSNLTHYSFPLSKGNNFALNFEGVVLIEKA